MLEINFLILRDIRDVLRDSAPSHSKNRYVSLKLQENEGFERKH